MDKSPFPKTGLVQYLSIGGANKAFGGKFTFFKCTGSIGRYFTIFNSHTFFPSISFSWADDTLPQVERPYIGGALSEERYKEMNVYNYISFSGLPPRALTGDLFGICHFEYRCEIKKNLFAHIVFDWGSAWNAGIENYREIIKDAPVGFGIGISYLTLLVPFRLSYGQLIKNSDRLLSDQKEFFYFSGGYDF